MLFVINGLCEKLVVLGQKNGHVTHEVLTILFQGTIDLNIKKKFIKNYLQNISNINFRKFFEKKKLEKKITWPKTSTLF